MIRMNTEISFNITRVVQVFREEGDNGLWELLTKAGDYLPMPHKQVPMDREIVNEIYAGLLTGNHHVNW